MQMTNQDSLNSKGEVGVCPLLTWVGQNHDLADELPLMRKYLLNFNLPVFAVKKANKVQLTNCGSLDMANGKDTNLAGWVPPISLSAFGDPNFCKTYGINAAYYTGGMANAIASENMVITLAQNGWLSSFGSGGLSIEKLSQSIDIIQSAVGNRPYMVNLLHNPFEPEMERKTVEILLKKGVHLVEASAYIHLTPSLVQYRTAGLIERQNGEIQIENHVIAKVSRREIALLFLKPAPENILNTLLKEGKISARQSELAKKVPMADDITVEADSGGHTDNRPLVSLLPSIIALRDQIQKEAAFVQPVRIGAAGGISTPASVLAAFMMGAAYVVTGSINQACVESAASEHTRKLLAEAQMADMSMAPSADMFELGSKVQVLKRGSMFPLRAQKLYDLYSTYNSIEEIPAEIRDELESRIFRRSMDDIWQETKTFFSQRNPDEIYKAEQNPKRKMALIFRWYLGLSSRWSRDGVEDRKMDYQIWCGPSMGAFNEWVRGTYLEDYHNRHVVDIARQLLTGCIYQYRVQSLRLQGVPIPHEIETYYPEKRA